MYHSKEKENKKDKLFETSLTKKGGKKRKVNNLYEKESIREMIYTDNEDDNELQE